MEDRFNAVRDKRMSELTPEQQEDARQDAGAEGRQCLLPEGRRGAAMNRADGVEGTPK